MSNYYWLKLHYDMLDDWKVGTLPDSLKWRFIQCLMVAGEVHENGFLPPLNQFAFRIRPMTPEALLKDMAHLASSELVELKIDSNGQERWYVTNYEKRQAKKTDAERKRAQRERDRQAQYHEPDTVQSRGSHDDVTTRDTDKIRLDKNRLDENAHEKLRSAVYTVTKLDPLTIEDTDFRRIDKLFQAGYSAEQVDTCYGSGGYWFTADWRGKKGQLPTVKDILTTIGQATIWEPQQNVNGSKPQQADQLLAIIGKYGRNRWKQAEPELKGAGLLDAVRHMGGWSHVCGMRETEIKFAFYEAVK